jgi:hypothetical protein
VAIAASREVAILERDMKFLRLPSLGALTAAVLIASLSAAPADARTICKGSGASAKCYTVKAKKKYAKKARTRTAAKRPRRVARLREPWHGWGASFHLDGLRYPGGNRFGPAASHNNFEGGFHPTVLWKLSDRASH